MSIQEVLMEMKNVYEQAILRDGSKAQTSLIRSQKLINLLHNLVKKEFLDLGVNPDLIHPLLGKTKPEIKIKGKLKAKDQDITIIPPEITTQNIKEKNACIERILAVNVRSQLSSMAKNIDTLYERTFAEPLNLHLEYSKQCLGEVYLIPTHEYCSKAMKNKKIKFIKFKKIADYIEKFQIINKRDINKCEDYKYERVCLLIVDFRQEQPKLYSTAEELKMDNLIPQDSNVSMNGLTFEGFASDILNTYQDRFGDAVNLIKS